MTHVNEEIDFDQENERLQRANFKKATSVRRADSRNEAEELLKALETIDSRDNDMVNINFQVNTALSKQYVLSQKEHSPADIPFSKIDPRIVKPQVERSEKKLLRETVRSFQPAPPVIKSNIQDEFKRQLEFLKSPYDTFINGRTTHQTFLSTRGLGIDPNQIDNPAANVDLPSRAADLRNYQPRAFLKHVVSQQNLHEKHLELRRQATEKGHLDEKIKKYMMMNEVDSNLNKPLPIDNYRRKYLPLGELEAISTPILIKTEMVVHKEINLEVISSNQD